MSNTPFFDALLAEYSEKKRAEILKTMSTPFMAPVKQPLPKRDTARLAQAIKTPDTDPEYVRMFQEFIQTMPMQILAGTPAGSFINSMDVVKKGDDYVIEAEVLTPTKHSESEAEYNGVYPQMAWVDEMETDEDGELYIAPVNPITFDRVKTELKTDLVAERFLQRQLSVYQHGVMAGRQKAAESHDDRFVPPMTEKTMPAWIAAEVKESNEALSDPGTHENVVGLSENIHMKDLENGGYNLPQYFKELVGKFREKYPDAEDVSIHREDELDGTITISVTGTTPEQTDESVNAASNNADSTSTVKPLWVTNEE